MGTTRNAGTVVTTAVGAVAALAAAFATGMAVAQPDGETPRPGRPVAAGPGPLPAYPNGDLALAEDCDELLDWYVERGLERVGPWGWDSPVVWAVDSLGGVADAGGVTAERGAAATAPVPQRATSGATGTNVQEAGVDEPDVVKTDGSLLVRVQDGDLVTYDVTGAEPERLGSLGLPVADAELLLVGDRVVVTMDREQEGFQEPVGARTMVVDVSDPEDPVAVDEATYDAELVTARQHGATVRLVLSAGLPDLDFVEAGSWGRSEESALEHNREVVRESTIEDWLPTVTRDGEAEPLLGCREVAIPEEDGGLGTLTVVGSDPAAPDTWSVTGVATASQMAYFSTDRLVLATAADTFPVMGWGCCEPLERVPATSPSDGSTHLYSFALTGTSAAYVASGQVDGSIADRWSMDEAGGVLRVAVGPTSRTGNFNSVVTLEEDGDDLVELGRVDKLGVNETIRSVRWFDELAFVVTFREVDPLYAVDLTDPADPRLLGKLKVPGFSEYLHPLGRHRLFGLGQSGGWGAQASLFDVTDLTDPRQLDVVAFRTGSVAGAGADPRQFTWLPDRRTVLTVIASAPAGGPRTGWVAVLTLADGEIRHRLVEVEYGDEVDQVRTVPLPDGRVLLVTGDTVSNFDL